MKKFMDRNFLLSSETAENLYFNFAERCPILDYHCHIDPQEIAENRQYENITQMWLYQDHYKWRLMRSNGVDEYYITGHSDDKEKFLKYAESLETAAGNPLYHWSHLELQRYFGYNGVLNRNSAEQVWDHCNGIIKEKKLNARSIIKASNVSCICTTDDPADDLKYHDMLNRDKDFGVGVFPAWRPDKVLNIEDKNFNDYIDKLTEAAGIPIEDWGSLTKALTVRMDYFGERGCRVSDHGLAQIDNTQASTEEVDRIFQMRRKGVSLTEEQCSKYRTNAMMFFGREYSRRNWVMQLHFGAKRNNNSRMFRLLGPDTGFDCIGETVNLANLADFLDALSVREELPKTVLYSLNPNDNAAIGTIIGCFQGGVKGKIQHGSAWWFNDNKTGMESQLTSLANLGHLGNFIGMTTDSRSILSYVRHEYFRRILCNLLGRWAEDGELPNDSELLGKMVQNISYRNGIEYFEFRGYEVEK